MAARFSNPRYNVIPLLLGTLKVTLIAMLIGTPLALAAALYTSEFAPVRLREWIKPAIELLAGIPSVVMGFFALIVLAHMASGNVWSGVPPECAECRHSSCPGRNSHHLYGF